MQTFKSSKRHNTVEVAITYQALNDRSGFESELNFVQDLTTLMVASRNIHNWEHDPIVRPNAYHKDPDTYHASIDLKFPIKSRVEGEDGEIKCYSYAGLHAVLVQISNICGKYASQFENFSAKLNLESMKAPWVIPVDGQGVILREGSRQIDYAGTLLPRAAIIGASEVEVVQLIAVGEHRAVDGFDRMWRHWANAYQDGVKSKAPEHPHLGRGPVLDLSTMKLANPNLPWQNVGVFALFKDAIGDLHWEQLGDMYNVATYEYILQVGNHMLATPLEFSNTSKITGNNIFLNDHAYYSFESAI